MIKTLKNQRSDGSEDSPYFTDAALANKLNVRPFAVISPLCDRMAARRGFRFTQLNATLHKNKWISLILDWTSNNDSNNSSSDFKYCTVWIYGSSHDDCSVHLQFPMVKTTFSSLNHITNKKTRVRSCFTIEVGIQIKNYYIPKNQTDKEHKIAHKKNTLKYKYAFTQNTKYGVLVWFAPNSWDNFKNSKCFFRADDNE